MPRSFGLVDGKVAEAEFFLRKISECGLNFFAAQYYTSAFASASRSITWALQAVLSGSGAFGRWYAETQSDLRSDPLARFFHKFRTVSQHIGANPVTRGSVEAGGNVRYYFGLQPDFSDGPRDDVETSCRRHFLTLLEMVYDCYVKFGPDIDAHQYFTAGNFERIGKTIEDAEEELGFPRGWTDIGDPAVLPHRWQALRDATTGCEIGHLFEAYLGKAVPSPDHLPL